MSSDSSKTFISLLRLKGFSNAFQTEFSEKSYSVAELLEEFGEGHSAIPFSFLRDDRYLSWINQQNLRVEVRTKIEVVKNGKFNLIEFGIELDRAQYIEYLLRFKNASSAATDHWFPSRK